MFIDNITNIELLIILTIINNLFAIKHPYVVMCVLSFIYGIYIDIIYIPALCGFSIIVYNTTILYPRNAIYNACIITMLCTYFAVYMNYAYNYCIDQILIYIYFSLKIYSIYAKKLRLSCLVPFIYNINLHNELQIYDHITVYFIIVFLYIMVIELVYL